MIMEWFLKTTNYFTTINYWLEQPHVWPWLVILGSIILGIISAWITWHILENRNTDQPKQRQPTDKIAWHNLDTKIVLEKLHSSIQGLAQTDISDRQQQYGLNRLPDIKPRNAFLCFLSQFHNLIIYVLLITAIITLALGHHVDSGVILGVVIINALIGYIQEGKAVT